MKFMTGTPYVFQTTLLHRESEVLKPKFTVFHGNLFAINMLSNSVYQGQLNIIIKIGISRATVYSGS